MDLRRAKSKRWPQPVLEARGLSKIYRRGGVPVHALDNVSLAVSAAEFVAVMGPSGSGKSTLLYLLGGLDRPSSGEMVLAGRSLSQCGEDELALIRRRKIGFVFQFYNLIPTLTAAENVALPLIIDGEEIEKHRERIAFLFQTIGLRARSEHRPDELSGGEQQRVAIARALATDPDIILADEPTGNLDSKTGVEILELLRRCADRFEQTIVMVTHDPKTAGYADRVIFLKDGAIVDELFVDRVDGPEEILRRFAALEEGDIAD